MKIEIEKITKGELDGEIVWVCHYNRPDMQKKALRNVPPTKVIVKSNDQLPKNKRVYYSESHFSPLNKKNKPLARIIPPFDNTGFRSRTGTPLCAFDNKEECVAAWNDQLLAHVQVLDVLIADAAECWRVEKEILTNAMS